MLFRMKKDELQDKSIEDFDFPETPTASAYHDFLNMTPVIIHAFAIPKEVFDADQRGSYVIAAQHNADIKYKYGLMASLVLEYWSIVLANIEEMRTSFSAQRWDKSLWEFLIERGIHPDDIWGYNEQIGLDAGQPEPDWLQGYDDTT